MNANFWQQSRKAVGKVLSFLYWSTAACLILSGASVALGLVAIFLFPFLPFIGPLFIMQAAGWFAQRDRAPAKVAPARADSRLNLQSSQRPSSA